MCAQRDRNVMLALVVAVYCLCSAVLAADSSTTDAGVPGAIFYESFGPGWQDRWHYSSSKKYEGRFDTVQPLGYQDTALQVSCSLTQQAAKSWLYLQPHNKGTTQAHLYAEVLLAG
jgi:hypothetical protein